MKWLWLRFQDSGLTGKVDSQHKKRDNIGSEVRKAFDGQPFGGPDMQESIPKLECVSVDSKLKYKENKEPGE